MPPSHARQGWLHRLRATRWCPPALLWALRLAGAVLVLHALWSGWSAPLHSQPGMLLGIVLAVVVGGAPLRWPDSSRRLSLEGVVVWPMLWAFGPAAALLAATGAALSPVDQTRRRQQDRWLSVAVAVLPLALVAVPFAALRAGLSARAWDVGWAVAALGAAALLHGLLRSGLHALAGRLRAGRRAGWTLGVRGWGQRMLAEGVVGLLCAGLSAWLWPAESGLWWCALLGLTAAVLAARHLLRVERQLQHARRMRQHAVQREQAREAALLQQHRDALHHSEQRFRRAFSHAAVGMALLGPDGEIQQANEALAALLAAPLRDIEGESLYRWLESADISSLQALLRGLHRGERDRISQELVCLRDDGTPVHVALEGRLFSEQDDGKPCLILQLQDISSRVLAEQRLHHVAFHDSLTRLPNRGQFVAQLEAAFQRFKADPTQPCAVMFLDFDRFKLINDSLGHDVGDAFLREVAERLRGVVPGDNLVARLGGDEFAVLLTRGDAIASVEDLAVRMQKRIRAPIQIRGHELHTSASIGIRVSDPTTQTAQEVLRDADTAMYRAKASGKARHCLFDAQMHAEAIEHLQMERELRVAVQRHDIGVALQPIIDIDSGRITAFEAFARWPHPRLGMLSAGRFVPMAEECGLGRALSLLALDEACRGIRQLCDATRQELCVQVNVGALEMSQPGFDRRVAAVLVRHSLPARQLLIEVSEAHVGRHREAMLHNLQGLVELGVGLSLDDFGSGYAALNQLSVLPFRQLKVDGRLLAQSDSGPGLKVLRALVSLGNSLGLTVVAEGVETAEQLQAVRQLGCRRAQGYLFGLPRPAVLWADALVPENGALRLVQTETPQRAGDTGRERDSDSRHDGRAASEPSALSGWHTRSDTVTA